MSKANMRKAFRSGFQFCSVCGSQSRLIEHHLSGRKCPDHNGDFNVMFCCPSCHDQIHTGDIIIESWVMTSHGRVLLWHGKNSLPVTDRVSTCPLYKKSPQ